MEKCQGCCVTLKPGDKVIKTTLFFRDFKTVYGVTLCDICADVFIDNRIAEDDYEMEDIDG